MKERLSGSVLIAQYKGGRRDFSEIECTSTDFTNMDLKGIIFRKANLQFCTFNGCELQGSDFSEANLDWAAFKLANLTEARFVKAKCRYALFDDAIFDRADVSGADFSWARMLNVNFHSANTRGASFVMAAFKLSDMNKEALSQVKFELSKHEEKIPFEVLMQIKFIASGTMDKLAAINMATREEPSSTGYRVSMGAGYKGLGVTTGGTGLSYSAKNPYKSSIQYKSEVPYRQ